MWNTYAARSSCVCRDYEYRESPPSIGLRRPTTKEYTELQAQVTAMYRYVEALRGERELRIKEFVRATRQLTDLVEAKSQRIARIEQENAERR